MKTILILILCLSTPAFSQDGQPIDDTQVPSQWSLVWEELAFKALKLLVTPLPVLIMEKNLQVTTFAEVVKNDPEAIRILKKIQIRHWNLNDQRNFLSFDYQEMDDIYIDEVGFCSGYTYVTWLMRYLVFYDPAGELLTPKETIKRLNQALYQLKPVTISGVGSLLELSSQPEIELYLKRQVARTWKEQSITTPGLGMYLDQYRSKSVDWKSVNSKIKFYIENGIQPIFYAVAREPWKKLGDPQGVRMIHVMPVMNTKTLELSDFQDEDFFKKNPRYMNELTQHVGRPVISMLHTVNRNFQKGFLQVGNDALMVGYDEEKNSVLMSSYIDLIYYQDRIAAQVAMNLKKAFGGK
ncbi:MAG: hypothetical protein KA715_12270 [Xanthomonadaceae bacterium]|nr:hypothetical protein [Xanthomonadaceae bacterium]